MTENLSDKAHILIVDDDDRIRDLLRQFLTKNGFLVVTAKDALEAKDLLSSLCFDLLILDIMMPGEDGYSVAKHIREEDSVPIIFLTAKGEVQDKLEGLMIGADDYITKPFEPKELLLRMEAILRRSAPKKKAQGKNRIGAWLYDEATGILQSGETEVSLTTVEKKLFAILIEQANEAVSRYDLAASLDLGDNERAIDVQVTRLRKKIEEDPKKPKLLQTVRGEGYMLIMDKENV